MLNSVQGLVLTTIIPKRTSWINPHSPMESGRAGGFLARERSPLLKWAPACRSPGFAGWAGRPSRHAHPGWWRYNVVLVSHSV